MSEAATRKDVAEMSESEMMTSLAEMFDVQEPSNEQPEEQAAEEVESTVDDDETTSQETEADEDTEVEADDERDDEDETSDDEKWTPRSLDELAEALEMSSDEVVSTLKIKTKVDGVEGEATLKDVIKSYQLEKTLNQRLEAHANERKTFEAQTHDVVQKLQERLQDVDSTASAMEQMLVAEYQGIDWSELKADDPTGYVLKQQELRDRYSAIQQVKTQMAEKAQAAAKQHQEQTQQQMQVFIQDQVAEMMRKVPEWKDDTRRATDLADIQSYLKANGATDQEIGTIVDHRVYLMALKAMRYDNMQSKADPKMKQMKTKPKFVKPGARKDPARVSDKRKQDAVARAKNLQTDDAWADALLAKFS